MNKKLNKNQWVAVISSLIVLAVIIFISYGNSPMVRDFTGSFGGNTIEALNSNMNFDLQKDILEKDLQNVDQLQITDLALGEGAEAMTGKTVSVNYIGVLPDGTKFDSSWDRGVPFEFTLGQGQVIAGWEQGILGMKEGGLRQLVIPSGLAYGEQEIGPISPNSTLIFMVELIEVKE